MRSKPSILLNKRKYTFELISELGLSEANHAVTPLEINQRLTYVEFDKVAGLQNLDTLVDVPKKSHMDASTRVVRYLKNAPGLGVLLKRESAQPLLGFCDSDWGVCPVTRRSVSGYLMKFGSSLISWKFKK
ncbi:secreted RxLR effector protein 161-like [Nicotiana tomentosiformis]|uniref:secreted RxLR effector protein 161-like n=1 Tax=Nicotiana tomentosiformis TaxID=4098 RepID=UPI00388CCF40